MEDVTSLTYRSDQSEENEEDIDYSEPEPGQSQDSANSVDTIDLQYKTRAVNYWRSGKRKNLKFATVQKKFRRLHSEAQLYAWKKVVDEGGSLRDKFGLIAMDCKEKFDAEYRTSTIHDVTIKQWALQSARSRGVHDFKASSGWLHNFKKKFGITSRKITIVTTTKKLDRETDIMAEAEMFVEKVREKIQLHSPSHVFNSDQSGFNLEMYNGRTLARRGEKSISTVVQSIPSTTHSYTIMPTVSAEGELLSPLRIVLKEKNGVFGSVVKKRIFSHETINVVCTTSGKMGKAEVQSWYNDILKPSLPDGKNILLLDSFSGHKALVHGTEVEVMTIPAGATAVCQPFDVYGFRIWKTYTRRIYSGLRLMNTGIVLHHRNTILKLQSLLHFQLSSPRFKNMWKYSWYRSGYLDDHPGQFEHPVVYSFDSVGLVCSLCSNTGFVKCAWCTKDLCVKHFYEEHHYCKVYVP